MADFPNVLSSASKGKRGPWSYLAPRAQLPACSPDTPAMEWWPYADDEVGGGVLEFDFRLELHVYRRLDEAEPVAVWLSDDAAFFRMVVVAPT